MKIEILTTKKKLSKSIVRQLQPAKLFDLEHCVNVQKIGYFVRDLGKAYSVNTALFQSNNGWRTIGLRNWTAVKDRPMVECPAEYTRGISFKKFDSHEERDAWLLAYNKMKELCQKNHLIL